jgi:hypothetical protein
MTSLRPTVAKFRDALPHVVQWIDATVAKHEAQAVPVSSLGFKRLPLYFPTDLLERAKVVCFHPIPRPPLSELGLPELSSFEQLNLVGITFRNTCFLDPSHRTEGLHFHELVHVLQWEQLGPERFLLAYGVGLVRFGYKNSPLEQMAYVFQGNFDRGYPLPTLLSEIRSRTERVWSEVAPLLGS